MLIIAKEDMQTNGLLSTVKSKKLAHLLFMCLFLSFLCQSVCHRAHQFCTLAWTFHCWVPQRPKLNSYFHELTLVIIRHDISFKLALFANAVKRAHETKSLVCCYKCVLSFWLLIHPCVLHIIHLCVYSSKRCFPLKALF